MLQLNRPEARGVDKIEIAISLKPLVRDEVEEFPRAAAARTTTERRDEFPVKMTGVFGQRRFAR